MIKQAVVNKTLAACCALGLLVFLPSSIANTGDLESLRGNNDLTKTMDAPHLKRQLGDTDTLPRNYVQQPPLIPHKIKGYKIDRRSNKCMTCHNWKNYQKTGATKISITHFKDRDGNELSSVAPRRYFCTQCHVPQVNATPLVKNKFKPVKSLN